MKRELRIVSTQQPIGELEIDAKGKPHFRKRAETALAGMRRKLGDEETAKQVMKGGWSNGYIYFADPQP
jgi:hypothetical protein